MVGKIKTFAFLGIECVDVNVEVQVSNGLPSFTIVGLADKSVAESKERIRSSFHAIGLSFPSKRIVVNLAPSDLSKEGSHYDLPISLALLVALEILPQGELDEFFAVGELGLDGKVNGVPCALIAAFSALQKEKTLICPLKSLQEVSWLKDLIIIPAATLIGLMNHFKGTQTLEHKKPAVKWRKKEALKDFGDVAGQDVAKRALQVAAAGRHNLLMMGPPGSGKSMLAERLSSLLPDLTPQEIMELSMIHSVSNMLEKGELPQQRPFRSPHHSSSLVSLVGGGNKVMPGEISLAHHGVLFLDELPEFSRQALEALRQPLEARKIVIARANSHVTFPSNFQLIAAMNPCHCGFMGDHERQCHKVPLCSATYLRKISGPILDRIDMHISVDPVPLKKLRDTGLKATSTKDLQGEVDVAWQVQKERYKDLPITMNAELSSKTDIQKYCTMTPSAEAAIEKVLEIYSFTARGYHRLLKLSRTIADMESAAFIEDRHLFEAASYRPKEIKEK